jgi:S-adenosylmethionine synthetase
MGSLKKYLFTSESVAEGHPDKLCDQISDAILDYFLKINPYARVACETFATPGKVIIGGEAGGISLNKKDVEEVVRNTIKQVGFEQKIFHWAKIEVENLMIEQSADIAIGVLPGKNKKQGAGDQGIMFGFACDQTSHYMPAPIYYSHKILQDIQNARKIGLIKGLGPDAKSQVTIVYKDDKPVRSAKVVVSQQHVEGLSQQEVKDIIRPYVIASFPDPSWMCAEEDFYVNPTSKFTIGGPEGDAGLTGRKIVVDTYGGACPHGGGAFSGKDPSKVDRSAAYALRYLAKNIVAAGIATKCILQVSYAIGMAEPLSIYINTNREAEIYQEKILKKISELFDLTPSGIIETLDLNKPIYQRTASYGHFGREVEKDGGFSWEKMDLVNEFRKI